MKPRITKSNGNYEVTYLGKTTVLGKIFSVDLTKEQKLTINDLAKEIIDCQKSDSLYFKDEKNMLFGHIRTCFGLDWDLEKKLIFLEDHGVDIETIELDSRLLKLLPQYVINYINSSSSVFDFLPDDYFHKLPEYRKHLKELQLLIKKWNKQLKEMTHEMVQTLFNDVDRA